MAHTLYEAWSAPAYNDSALAKKTFSYRFPVHIAARLAALEEMFPEQSRSEIVIGILKEGLKAFESSLPAPTVFHGDPDNHNPNDYFDPHGPKITYGQLTNKHYVDLEKARGVKEPKPLLNF